MKRVLKWSGVAVVAVLVLGTAAGVLVLRRRAAAQASEAKAQLDEAIRRHDQAFREDERLLSKVPALLARQGGRDAGPALNGKVRWQGGRGPSSTNALKPPEALQKQVEALGAAWPEKAPEVDLSAVDLGWMKDLEGYDYWEVLSAANEGGRLDFVNVPLPAFGDLLFWSKVRLMQGLKDGTLDEAGPEVDALARLCASTELLVGEMVGVAMRRNGLLAFDRASKSGKRPATWDPLSDDVLTRLRRAGWAYVAYAQPLADAALVGDLWTSPDAQAGRCAALQDALGLALTLRPLVAGELKDGYARLDAILEATKGECRMPAMRAAWAKPPRAEETLKAACAENPEAGTKPPGWCKVAPLVLAIPGAKGAAGLILTSVATPRYFDRYDLVERR